MRGCNTASLTKELEQLRKDRKIREEENRLRLLIEKEKELIKKDSITTNIIKMVKQYFNKEQN